jgi:polar amino acid transport system permease protein
MEQFLQYLASGYLWNGMVIAIQITAISMVLALLLGLLLAVMRDSSNPLISTPALIYIWFIRGTPILLQLVFLYTALPEVGLVVGAITTAIIGFTLNEAAFAGEIIRGGIRSVNRSQVTAAASLGMGQFLTLRRIVLPQALRAILPALGNDAISMLKFTSLASVIAVDELMLRSQTIVAQNFLFFQVFCAAGVMYLAVTTVMSFGQSRLERRLQLDRPAPKGSAFSRRPVPKPGSGPSLVDLIAKQSEEGGSDDRPFVEIRDVHKSYGALEVLKGIDLTVKRGEVVVLMGPSGSGKSTLLRHLNHLETLDAGEILVDGAHVGYLRVDGALKPVRDLARARADARIGMVFQHFNLFEHLTAVENVAIAPTLVFGEKPEEARRLAASLLTDVGLGHHLDHLPHNLSGGQQQRVAIARALAIRPRLMLFDEPTSALDPELVGDVLAVMRRLAQAGMTMMVVTHEVRFARDVADRIVFMADGQVVEEGRPDEILVNPREERTRKFLSHLIEEGVAA